jgi:hypothetical protein
MDEDCAGKGESVCAYVSMRVRVCVCACVCVCATIVRCIGVECSGVRVLLQRDKMAFFSVKTQMEW